MRKVFRIFCLLLLPAAPAFSGEDWGVQQLMQTLSQVKHAESRFVEKKQSVYLITPIIVRGFLSYDAPLKLEKRSTSPVAERFTVTGDRVEVEREVDGKRSLHRLSLSDHPVLRPFVESVRATLAGDLATLERYYVVACTGAPEQWRLVLLPREAEFREVVSEVRISGRGNAINVIEVREASGDSSLMTVIPAK